MYAVASQAGTTLIDAGSGFGVESVLASLRQHGIELRSVKQIVLTHTHWDHARGAAALKEATGAQLVVHSAGRAVLEVGPWMDLDGVTPLSMPFVPVGVDEVIDEGDEIELGERALKVVHTPGHSVDSICLELALPEGTRVLFSGDTVLAAGKPGITTMHTDFGLYARSLDRLVERQVDALLPGHGMFILEGASEQVEYLRKQLRSKWVNPAGELYPAPFESGAWFVREHPELATD